MPGREPGRTVGRMPVSAHPNPIRRVLIAGGGVAALEAALALKALAEDRVDVTLLAPSRTFAYRPLAATEPFGGPEVVRFQLAAIAADRGLSLVRDAVAGVDAARHRVRTQGGASLRYDSLVLALGGAATEAVRGADAFRGPQDVERMRETAAAAAAGELRSIAFVAPPGSSWTLPVYELALGTAQVAARAGADVELTVVTPERRPLQAFGQVASDAVSALLARRGIRLRTHSFAEAVAEGRLWLAAGDSLGADRVVALPRLLGRRIDGVPADDLGFVPVDLLGRVDGLEDVYAAGDGTSGPLKQGGVAAQQAGAAAAAIAATAGAPVEPEPYEPVLRATLATGDGALYLREPAAPGEPAVSTEPPWWPPSKIVARHLAPYLAANLGLAEPAALASLAA